MIKNIARFKTELRGIYRKKSNADEQNLSPNLKDYPIQKKDYHFKQSDSYTLRI